MRLLEFVRLCLLQVRNWDLDLKFLNIDKESDTLSRRAASSSSLRCNTLPKLPWLMHCETWLLDLHVVKA